MDLFNEMASALRPETRSVNDQALIYQAWKCSYLDYYKIGKMMDQADTEETRELLDKRHSYLYHMEEYHSGNL